MKRTVIEMQVNCIGEIQWALYHGIEKESDKLSIRYHYGNHKYVDSAMYIAVHELGVPASKVEVLK